MGGRAIKRNIRRRTLQWNNKGMTLVEVIVSIALVGIIASMVALIFSAGIRIAARSGDNTKVTGMASGVLENSLGDADLITSGGSLYVVGETDPIATGTYIEVPATAVVDFRGEGTTDITIDGTFMTMDATSEQNDSSLKVFRPGVAP